MNSLVSPLGDRGPRWPWLRPAGHCPHPPHGGCWGLSATIMTRHGLPGAQCPVASGHQPFLALESSGSRAWVRAWSFFFFCFNCGKIHIKSRDADLITRLGRSLSREIGQRTAVLCSKLMDRVEDQATVHGVSRVGHSYRHTQSLPFLLCLCTKSLLFPGV